MKTIFSIRSFGEYKSFKPVIEYHQIIKRDQPEFFVFEFPKGATIEEVGTLIKLTGGKSVNGVPCLFPLDDSIMYHVYTKEYKTNDAFYLVGIKNDHDNRFQFPCEIKIERNNESPFENIFEKIESI
jgi:hypothetical protein